MRNPGRLIFVLMLLYGAPLFAQSAPSSGSTKRENGRQSWRDHSRYWYSCADGLNAKAA
jgi:hypothetical protein